MADKWIQKATSKNKGTFKKKAEDAAQSNKVLYLVEEICI